MHCCVECAAPALGVLGRTRSELRRREVSCFCVQVPSAPRVSAGSWIPFLQGREVSRILALAANKDLLFFASTSADFCTAARIGEDSCGARVHCKIPVHAPPVVDTRLWSPPSAADP